MLEAKVKTTHAVEFSCHAPWARSIFLVGTFNRWNASQTPMSRDDEGSWTVTLELRPGLYEYKLVVDGEWCCSPGCCDSPMLVCLRDCVPNVFGTMNRSLIVGNPTIEASAEVTEFEKITGS